MRPQPHTVFIMRHCTRRRRQRDAVAAVQTREALAKNVKAAFLPAFATPWRLFFYPAFARALHGARALGLAD